MEYSKALIGLFALILLYVLDSLRVSFRRGLRNLPGPFFARFSGLYRLSMVTKGDAPLQYRNVHERYGPVVRVGPNHVSIADPALIPVIYGINNNYLKTKFYSTMTPFVDGEVMELMFTTRDPVFHKAFKQPVAQLFSMTNMKNYETYADECTEIFIKAMRDLEGQAIDLSVWLQWYAFDVIASITFQRRFGFLEERKDVKGLIEGLTMGLAYIKNVGQFPGLHPYLMGNRRLMRFLTAAFPNLPDPLATFVEITREEMKRYDETEKDSESGRVDFLAQLRQKGEKISDIDMLNHLTNNLLAGSDTTAIALRAVFYYLIKNPKAYKKLTAEIDDADNHGQLSKYITYDECLKLTYLQAVMKEAMRLHPSVGMPLERFVPNSGLNVAGVQLPAGTVVSIIAPVLHHDKTVFGTDADDFRPERWIDVDPEQLRLMNRSFLTFGSGTRTCIGKNISLMEMGKLIPQFIRLFDIEWASPDPEWELDAAWFWKQSKVICKLHWRGKDFEM